MREEEERLQAKVHGPPQPVHMLWRTQQQRLVTRTRVRQALMQPARRRGRCRGSSAPGCRSSSRRG